MRTNRQADRQPDLQLHQLRLTVLQVENLIFVIALEEMHSNPPPGQPRPSSTRSQTPRPPTRYRFAFIAQQSPPYLLLLRPALKASFCASKAAILYGSVRHHHHLNNHNHSGVHGNVSSLAPVGRKPFFTAAFVVLSFVCCLPLVNPGIRKLGQVLRNALRTMY